MERAARPRTGLTGGDARHAALRDSISGTPCRCRTRSAADTSSNPNSRTASKKAGRLSLRELGRAAVQVAVLERAVPAVQRRVHVAGVAAQFHEPAGRQPQPAEEEAQVVDVRRVGDAGQRFVARQSGPLLPRRRAAAEAVEEQPLHPRPRHPRQRPGRLAHPADERPRGLIA